MFIYNKYYYWYTAIIDNAQRRCNRTLYSKNKAKALLGYIEEHHIIPRSLGGSNLISNKVWLTAREHFICHWLLTKFVSTNVEKMKYALWAMMNVKNEHQVTRYKINSHVYNILKEKLVSTFSKQQKGRVHSAESRKKISDTRKRKIADGTIKVNENKEKYKEISKKRKGSKHSEKTKEKISKSNTGKTRSEEHKQMLSELNTGKVWPEERRKKLSERLKQDYKSGRRNKISGMSGKSMSQEAKEKIRQARLKYWENKRTENGTQS